MYWLHSESDCERHRVIVARDVCRALLPLARTPIRQLLGARSPPSGATPISREHNANVLNSVFEVFDPSLRPYLASVPIVFDATADTAKAYAARGYIGVSPDWDSTVLNSRYRAIYEQRGMTLANAVFANPFKTSLLIHEFLHLLQVRQGIDSGSCFAAVSRWYLDPHYGAPSPNRLGDGDKLKNSVSHGRATNRIKYILWHNLYNQRRLLDLPQDERWQDMRYWERYRYATQGVEEFAYIGEEILASGSASANYVETGRWSVADWKDKEMAMAELSPEVIALFSGVFNPELLPQRRTR